MNKVIDGLIIHYESRGKGKNNLLILHGWGGSIREWEEVANCFIEKHTVTRLDLPGFGNSSQPVKWGIYEYADFVEKFIRQLNLDRLTIIGHSFGGRIGIVLASRGLQLEQLVLVDAAGVEWRSLVGKILPSWVKVLLRGQDYKQYGDMKEIFSKVVSQSLRGGLHQVSTKTTIVWGENDQVLPFEEAKILQNEIPNATLRIVWGAGHWPHLEKRDKFIEVLKEEGI